MRARSQNRYAASSASASSSASRPTVAQPRRARRSCPGTRSAGSDAAVLQLEELHAELDVGQRAAPELEVELRVLARWDALALDARLHAAHLARVGVGERPRVHDVVDELAEPLADVGVAGHEPRLHQRLALPGEAPLVVVAGVAAERAGERALAPLGAEAGVDRGTSGPRA